MVWGSDPEVSPDGNKIAFYTSRNALQADDFTTGELWIKDLISGDEWPIFDEGYVFIGWGEDNVYVRQNETVKEINIFSGESRVIDEEAFHTAVSYPYFVSQSEYESNVLNIMDLRDSKVRTMEINFFKSYWQYSKM